MRPNLTPARPPGSFFARVEAGVDAVFILGPVAPRDAIEVEAFLRGSPG
jgi:hypothetical protein